MLAECAVGEQVRQGRGKAGGDAQCIACGSRAVASRPAGPPAVLPEVMGSGGWEESVGEARLLDCCEDGTRLWCRAVWAGWVFQGHTDVVSPCTELLCWCLGWGQDSACECAAAWAFLSVQVPASWQTPVLGPCCLHSDQCLPDSPCPTVASLMCSANEFMHLNCCFSHSTIFL